ncbi:MAG: DNA circularization protein [Hyphomicrobiaceae bacterium]
MADCPPDWLKTLRRASFRGVPFFVEHDDIKYGRRLKVHEFPNRDRPFVEDLGEKVIHISVTAYVASSNVLAEKSALVSACRRRGAGALVLPTEGSISVKSHTCTRQHNRDKLGLIAFQLEFIEAGTEFGTFTTGLLERLVSVAGEAAVQAIGLDFIASYNAIAEASWVIDAAAGTISTWLQAVDALQVTSLSATAETAANASELVYRIERLNRDVTRYALSGPGLVQSASNHLDLGREDQPATIWSEMADVMQLVRLSSPSNEVAVRALAQLASYDPVTLTAEEAAVAASAMSPPVSSVTIAASATGASSAEYPATWAAAPSVLAEARNEAVINSMMRRQALIEYAIAVAQSDYPTRREAIQARADLAELFARELATGGRAFAALDEVRNRAAMAISRKVADLRPTIMVEAHASEPSLVWAWRLYGDTKRATELARRNRVRHPAFMPPSFEAEAPE